MGLVEKRSFSVIVLLYMQNYPLSYYALKQKI